MYLDEGNLALKCLIGIDLGEMIGVCVLRRIRSSIWLISFFYFCGV